MLSLLEILECVEILFSPKVQYSDISVHLESGRLVHLGKTVCPRHWIYISRSHEAGGRGWNRPCPIDKIARCGDLISGGLDICNRVGCLPYSHHGRATVTVDESGLVRYADWWGYEITMVELLAEMYGFR